MNVPLDKKLFSSDGMVVITLYQHKLSDRERSLLNAVLSFASSLSGHHLGQHPLPPSHHLGVSLLPHRLAPCSAPIGRPV